MNSDPVTDLSQTNDANSTQILTENDINPHMPTYIKKAPWYANDNSASLNHQRKSEDFSSKHGLFSEFAVKKGLKNGTVTKFREGACENCGAITHIMKNCLERPRAVGAKYSKIFGKDEHLVPEKSKEFDSKRDRWYNYDPNTYKLVVERFQREEEERSRIRAEELRRTALETTSKSKRRRILEQLGEVLPIDDNNVISDGSSSSDTEFLDTEKGIRATGQAQKGSMFTTMRSRTDVAKYLLNLDTNSAMYDPKTRSMRENPLEGMKESEDTAFKGDNSWRSSIEAKDAIRLQAFALNAQKCGTFLSPAALPTQTEMMWKEHARRKEEMFQKREKELKGVYGDMEDQEMPRDVSALRQNDRYIEFNPDGTLKEGKGMNEAVFVQSCYAEDEFEGGHSTVWGSWWNGEKWGFKCCESVDRFSKCKY